jgi:4-diphosphocytidyl-2-C-methyl-D-erythritol kinase
VRVAAKINLNLQVGERRADGYHAVRTEMQSVALFDVVRLAEGEPHLSASGFPVPLGPDNLAWKAVAVMAEAAGRPPRVRIRLQKRIPPGAGLGGGSADAAGVILALRELWQLPWDDGRLEAVAASLGSDVPFFIRGGRALATGRGEVLEPLQPLAPDPVVIVKPPFGVSTRDAYRWFDEIGPGDSENDLERAVFAHHPELAAAKGALREAGALRALMSGSGSAVYGIMPSVGRARAVAHAFLGRGWWAAATRLLP